MKDNGTSRHGPIERAGLQQIRPEERQRPGGLLGHGQQVFRLPGIRGIADGGADVEAALEQPLDQPRRDVAVASRDQDRTRVGFTELLLPRRAVHFRLHQLRMLRASRSPDEEA